MASSEQQQNSTHAQCQVDIAIVGGGIVGLILAVGLLRRGVKVKVYEQARGFREIGAGIAFNANALRCMRLIDPSIVTALRSSGSIPNSSDPDDPNDYFRWVDGYNQVPKGRETDQRFLYQICAGSQGAEGCRRDQFLEALAQLVPAHVIVFQKRLVDVVPSNDSEAPLILTFEDRTVAQADAVFGCDGVKSYMRRIVLGHASPASYAHYSHKFAFRGLVPMDQAITALGDFKAKNEHMHLGPGAHLIHYPVANHTMVNVAAFVDDPGDWPDDGQMVVPATREDVQEVFRDWVPCIRSLVSLLPEKLDKWAMYDTWDFPAPRFNKDKMCLVGDAAHASTPHHGAGACMGVEDVLCLVNLAAAVAAGADRGEVAKGRAWILAFETFNSIRRPRTQWLVDSSRRVCDLYEQQEWGDSQRWTKAEVCFEEIRDRTHKIWHFDGEDMVEETNRLFAEGLAHLS
ncbi:FAD binding domain-containing protein [Thozetella sp. PMI_491]|nr:FAD binding domain-containing protein [Thozetella sp. PMI_491]